jgi:hypothetical protein
MSIRGRINFLQLARYGKHKECYHPILVYSIIMNQFGDTGS